MKKSSKELTSIQWGDLLEYIVKRLYENDGYCVEQARRITQKIGKIFVSKKIDFFAVDLICIKSGEKTKWIQVTSQKNAYIKNDKLNAYKWNYEHSDVLVYRYRECDKNNGFIIYSKSADSTELKITDNLEITLNEYFKIINEYKELKNLSAKSICNSLHLDYDEYKLMRKFAKKTNGDDISNE